MSPKSALEIFFFQILLATEVITVLLGTLNMSNFSQWQTLVYWKWGNFLKVK